MAHTSFDVASVDIFVCLWTKDTKTDVTDPKPYTKRI